MNQLLASLENMPTCQTSETDYFVVPSWQESLKYAFRDPMELAEFLKLTHPESLAAEVELGTKSKFPLFVTREFARRIRPNDWNDPLLKQVWVDTREDILSLGFVEDPVGDRDVEIAPGLLHKYHGRVLLVATGVCAIHCRYCFRRHYPYSSAPKSIDQWEPALAAIAADESIQEVILSGGDPLSIVDASLDRLIVRLDEIAHLKRLRIHTRFPILIPSRVTETLCDSLQSTRLSKWIVLHCNHANEIDEEVNQAIQKLRRTDSILLNQAVLLRDVNDSVDALCGLSERLMDAHVIPYYLHQLDPVQGAAHFEVPIETGKQLLRDLSTRLPGYAVPKYVYEQPGAPNKLSIY